MAKVIIHNRGQRTIIVAGGKIPPAANVKLEQVEAEKLLKLYAGELIGEQEAVEIFSEPATTIEVKAEVETDADTDAPRRGRPRKG